MYPDTNTNVIQETTYYTFPSNETNKTTAKAIVNTNLR